MSASQLFFEMALSALKMLASYGQNFLSLIFLFSAGLLFFRTKSAPAGVFFGGLLITTLISLTIRIMIEFQRYESAIVLQEKIQLLSMVGFVATAIQVTGFLVFVLRLPNVRDKIVEND
ncbi:MAG TPA: hypothetical protein PKL58_00435 [Methylophilaceae bacterium]|nr:hypothetical protein [Methylophilaceae bacterium]